MNKPIQSAQYKASPDDFIVTELMPIADNLTGNGEHLWLLIKKRNINTPYLIELLAKIVHININDIGYSGLKDKNAVTYQWVSLRLPKINEIETIQHHINSLLSDNEHIEIIKHHWHNKKLNRGTHKANHFDLILRNVIGNKSDIENALQAIKQNGIPNYFGEQRFGNDNSNLSHAKTFFKKQLKAKNPKRNLSQKESLWVSSVRSFLFNEILTLRVKDNTWNQAIKGDVFNLNGTHSLFVADIDDDIRNRITIGDIHPTAPLFGIDNKLTSCDDALLLEQQIFNNPEYNIFIQGLLKLKIKSDRRALRVLLTDFNWQWQDDNTLLLHFSLPTGSFATAVLDQLTNNS